MDEQTEAQSKLIAMHELHLYSQDWMRANETSSMRAGLPGWSTADKTGSGDFGTANDVGIAYGPQGQQLLLSIMTRSAGDDPEAPSRRDLIGELAALVSADLYGGP